MLANDVVLVVDDSSSIRQIITATLRTHLFCRNILQASSGKEALELIEKTERIDWILSDWEMPRMGGDELLLKVRQNPKTQAVPFIMITSRKDRDSLVTAAQAGVTDYLIKPFTASALTDKLRKVAVSLERRAHARFIAETTNRVRITLKNGFAIEGRVDNISETGLLCKAPLFRTEIGIYDEIDIVLNLGNGEEVATKAELLRVENDRENPRERQFVKVAVRFVGLGGVAQRKLAKFVASLGEQAPPESLVE